MFDHVFQSKYCSLASSIRKKVNTRIARRWGWHYECKYKLLYFTFIL